MGSDITQSRIANFLSALLGAFLAGGTVVLFLFQQIDTKINSHRSNDHRQGVTMEQIVNAIESDENIKASIRKVMAADIEDLQDRTQYLSSSPQGDSMIKMGTWKVSFQRDANICVYDASSRPKWCSNTAMK